MEITLTTTIPDDTAANLQNGSAAPLPRRLLELAVIKAYESSLITEREVLNVLGFKDREALCEFFKQYDLREPQRDVSAPHASYQRTLDESGRRQEAILKQVESSCWPEEPDIPEAPITSSIKEFLL